MTNIILGTVTELLDSLHSMNNEYSAYQSRPKLLDRVTSLMIQRNYSPKTILILYGIESMAIFQMYEHGPVFFQYISTLIS